MIQITQLKLPVDHSAGQLENKIRKTLRLGPKDSFTYEILRRSYDCRQKPDLLAVYTVSVSVKNEDAVQKRAHSANVTKSIPKVYRIPAHGSRKTKYRPVVIGAGPAGLFAAYLLTEAGFSPLVLERGKRVEERQKDVAAFWETGILNVSSNVQFGEGGAGTFSDGKLNTVVKDPSGKNRFVLETFVRFGASPDILYDAKPHIGTDVLSGVVANMRRYMEAQGTEFCFETCVKDFLIENETLVGLRTKDRMIPVQTAVLAIGHSARDTFLCLNDHQVPMEVKSFAVGFRVEHPQAMIDEAMYGIQKKKMPAAPYKVTSNFPGGRGVYSFCMCPGGYVVNSSSEQEETAVNGMSYSGRNGSNANSAIIVSVTPRDFGADDPLAGLRYQRKLEHETWLRGKGAIPQQLFGDFREGRESSSYGDFSSRTKGRTVFAGLNGLMNEEMEQSFILGMEHFARIIPDFDRRDAILSGMESRTSSPVRILRDEGMESKIKGLYPCGEGAGYAGGITSAAIDGIRVAEAVITRYCPAE